MNIATEMLELAKAAMAEQFAESRWFKTAPAAARAAKPVIEVTGIEQREVRLLEGGMMVVDTYMAPFLVGIATVGGIQAKLSLRLEFGGSGLVVEEQSVA